MAYTFPKSRRGSYAIPQYVKDEGLERHAFVTLQVPDGTFDNPAVGDGGYVVPKYVLKDPIGQGVSITKWAPRGTYYGKKIPNWLNQTGNVIVNERPAKGGGTAITMVGLGDVPSSVLPFQKYGNQVASLLMGHVKKVPPQHRKAELKRVMNAIDPSLWNRAAAISSRNLAAGMSPASALHAGIARAAATGIHAEVIHTGRTQTLPKAQSLMGMGCYGCEAALGALMSPAADIRATSTLVAATAAPTMPADGTCSADSQLIWHGTWMRRRDNEACKTIDPNFAATVGTAGVSVDFPLTKGTIQAGPFFFSEPTFNYRNQEFRIQQKDAAKIPQSWLVFLQAATKQDKIGDAKGIFPFDPAKQPVSAASYMQWFQLFGGVMPPANPSSGVFQTIKPVWNTVGVLSSMPLATYAITGKDFPMLVRVSLATRGDAWGPHAGDGAMAAYNGPLDLLITTYPPPQGGVSMPAWIAQLPTEVHASEIVSAISDLACGAIKIAGQTSKDPAVQAGAVIGGAICGTPPAPTCPPGSIYDPNSKMCVVLPPPKSALLPVAIVGGAALVALFALHRRKHPR